MADLAALKQAALHTFYGQQTIAPLVCFGASTTGPAGIPITVDTRTETFSVEIEETKTLAQGATSLTLLYPPQRGYISYRYDEIQQHLIRDILRNATLDDATLTFDAHRNSRLTYPLSYLVRYALSPSRFWLTAVAKTALASGLQNITYIRINGDHAAASLTTGDSTLLLMATSAGSSGNEVSVSVSNSVLEITLPAWRKSTTYRFVLTNYTTLDSLVEDIVATSRVAGGYITAAADLGHVAPTFANTTVTFSGGDDGLEEDTDTLDLSQWNTQLVSALETLSIDRCSALYLPIDPTSAVTDLMTALAEKTLDLPTQPALFFGLGETSRDALDALRSDTGDIADVLAAARAKFGIYQVGICVPVLGECDTSHGRVDVAAAAALRFVLSDGRRAITGQIIDASTTYPSLRKDDQSVLESHGVLYVVPAHQTFRIAHDTPLTLTDTTPYPLYVVRTAQIMRERLSAAIEPLIGETEKAIPDLSATLSTVLANIPALKTAAYETVYKPVEGTLEITIFAELFGEVSFKLVLLL